MESKRDRVGVTDGRAVISVFHYTSDVLACANAASVIRSSPYCIILMGLSSFFCTHLRHGHVTHPGHKGETKKHDAPNPTKCRTVPIKCSSLILRMLFLIAHRHRRRMLFPPMYFAFSMPTSLLQVSRTDCITAQKLWYSRRG